MKQVIGELQSLRRRTQAMLILQRLAVVAAWVLGAMLALALADYALRLPSAFRLVTLLLGLAGVGFAVWDYVLPAWRFRPSLTQLALRVERVMPAVAGRLASSVEFAAAGVDQDNVLAARTVNDTQSRLSGESVFSAVSSRQTWRDIGLMIGVAVIMIAAAGWNQTAAATALQRMLLPYSDAQWPARTGVDSLMSQVVRSQGVHPRGTALPLRAKVTKGPADQHVEAVYRLKVDGQFEDWRPAIVLTHQGEGIHERLVDTHAEAIELYFQTDDAQTRPQTIELPPSPAVVRATLTVTPPSYAAPLVPAYEAELGPGMDQRSVTDQPSLVGSSATLLLELNKPLPVPADGAARESWLRRTLGWNDDDLPGFSAPQADGQAHAWKLHWPLNATRQLSLRLTDQYGLENAEDISYRIDAVEDREPSVTITQPEADEAVLPTAVIPLTAEARDDVALREVALEATRQLSDGTAGTAEWTHSQSADAAAGSAAAELDLGKLSVGEGDIVLVTGVARDGYEMDGSTHEPARSPVRRLRVISEMDLGDQLRRELGALRQNAIRIEAMQGELQQDIVESGLQPGAARGQAQVGERLDDQTKALAELQQRMERNRLSDDQLSSLIEQSQDLLRAAGEASNKAVAEAERRARSAKSGDEAGESSDASASSQAQPGQPSAQGQQSQQGQQGQQGQQSSSSQQPGQQGQQSQSDQQKQAQATDEQQSDAQLEPPPQIAEPQPEDRELVEAQQEVRDELSDLIELLDRDEDTWAATRMLEELLQDQQKLEAETAGMQQQTMGRSRDELTPQELSDLDRIAQRQRDLAERSRQLTEQLRQRAQDLERVDPNSAQGLREAADTSEQEELEQNQQRASEEAQQNQLQRARASQQAAQRTMQRMLDNISDMRRAKAEQLQRQLASLVESIQRLVSVQENELDLLHQAIAAADFTGRDRGMIRLHQNTQGVAEEARATGMEARGIARLLDRAADAQGEAIGGLRAIPAAPETAQAGEERSLEVLREALEEAKKQQQQAEEDAVEKRREEILAIYRELAEKQIVIRNSTLALAEKGELERRELIEARQLGNAQEEIRTALNDLRNATAEIGDAVVFKHVHRTLDEWSSQVTTSLREGDVGEDVTGRQQQIADGIGRLIQAMEQDEPKPNEFEQESGGGENSGGGAQPLIPPVSQLKLLRGMQEQIYDLTKAIDARPDLAPAQRRTRLQELEQSQRELMEIGREMLQQLPENGGPPAEGESGPESGEQPEPQPQEPPEVQPCPIALQCYLPQR